MDDRQAAMPLPPKTKYRIIIIFCELLNKQTNKPILLPFSSADLISPAPCSFSGGRYFRKETLPLVIASFIYHTLAICYMEIYVTFLDFALYFIRQLPAL